MKKVFKNSLFTFILGALLFGSISTILAEYVITANQVSYTPEVNTWEVSDVQNAVNELYDIAKFGDATPSDIVSGKTALVNNMLITGTHEIPNYTELSGNIQIAPGQSSTILNGYYKLNNYNVSCSACQPITYIDPDAVFNITFSKSGPKITATKTYTLNGIEYKDTDTLSGNGSHNFGGITISRSAVGGNYGYRLSIKNTSDSKILYNSTYYEPDETIIERSSNAGDYSIILYLSKLY